MASKNVCFDDKTPGSAKKPPRRLASGAKNRSPKKEPGKAQIELTETTAAKVVRKFAEEKTKFKLNFKGVLNAKTHHEIREKLGENKYQHYKKLFDEFDPDKSGYIDAEELHKMMQKINQGAISLDELQEIITEFDKDGDGRIDFEEFVAIFVSFHDEDDSLTSHCPTPTSNLTNEVMEAPVYASSQPSSSSYYEDSENDEGPLIEDKPKEEPIQID